jgi:hypothetical protein
MHFILLVFEYVSKFLDDTKIKRIVMLILIISVLFLLVEVSALKSKLISYEEKIGHHQTSITTAFEKLNHLDDFIRDKLFKLLEKTLDNKK